MNTFRFVADGFKTVFQTKRLILLIWLVNAGVALLVAIPMLNQIDRSLAGGIREEELLGQFDENWYRTFRFDTQDSETARLLDYSIFGAAPFIHHADRMLSGGIVTATGEFLLKAIESWRLEFNLLSMLTLLALLYAVLGSFVAGGLVSTYWSGVPVTVSEFIADSGRFFGRFIRLAVIGLLVCAVIIHLVGNWGQISIARWTYNEPSELTPFIFYLIKNVVVAFLIATVVMSLDYAKIVIVAEERVSALVAFGSGVAFTFGNFGRTFPLFFVLWAAGLALMGLYGVTEGLFGQTTYWSIVAVFVLQQVYMVLRLTVKAGFYASEIGLVRQVEAKRVRAVIKADSTAGGS